MDCTCENIENYNYFYGDFDYNKRIMIMKDIKKIANELIAIPGISGYEGDFAEYVCEKLKKYCPDAQVTKTNCVLGTLPSKNSDAPVILLEAHLDRVGLIVSSVDENGFVSFKTLGGVDERILPACEVRILGRKEVFGIIGAKPPHLMAKSEEKEGLKIQDMLIDTGLGAEASELISVGDPILLESEFCELMNDRISSGALDNRLSMATVFAALEQLKDKELPYNVCVAFTSGEELGLQGAYTIVDHCEPDLAIVVDVTYGTTPDACCSETFPLGSGVAICRGPNVHYEMTKQIMKIAKKSGIPYEIEVAPRSTGTNAWAIQTSGSGVPCVVISIPLRYMHTTVETADLNDAANVCRLICEIICGGEVIA